LTGTKTIARYGYWQVFKDKYGPEFEKSRESARLIWDTIAAAVVIDPTLIVEEETRWIDVNAAYTADYGRSIG
jgi:inosine-uridine nucleoside N-ribohydrolase